MQNVQLRCQFAVMEVFWPLQLDLSGVCVDEDAYELKFAVQQRNAVIATVGDQHAAFAVR